MTDIWHSIHLESDAPAGTIIAASSVDADSLWFDGHFPGDPILPAIAVLSMAVEAIRRHEQQQERHISLTGIRRVRFRMPIRPEDPITLSIACEYRDQVGTYPFKVAVGEVTACTGLITARIEEATPKEKH